MLALRLAVLIAAFLPYLVLSKGGPKDDSNGLLKKIKKKPKEKDLLGMKPAYEAYLIPQAYTRGSWDTKYIPEDCKDFAKKAGIHPKYMEVYNVTYYDCPVPWFMCFHKDVGDHLGLVGTFGRLPIRMRSWVKHLVAFPIYTRPRLPKGKKHQMATESNGNIVFYGPVKEWLDIMLHLAGHVLDQHGAYGPTLAESEIWDKAIHEDKRVPSKLAQTNKYEDVAENTIMAIYFAAMGVKMDPDGPDDDSTIENEQEIKRPDHDILSKPDQKRWSALRHQQEVLFKASRANGKGPAIFAKGGECSRRVPPSAFVLLEPMLSDTVAPEEIPGPVLPPGIEPIELQKGAYNCLYPEGKGKTPT